MQAVFDEHITLPGAPQIVVTRGTAYRFLRYNLGLDPSARGFASMDYLVFARPEVAAPLTDWRIAAPLMAFMELTENPPPRSE